MTRTWFTDRIHQALLLGLACAGLFTFYLLTSVLAELLDDLLGGGPGDVTDVRPKDAP